MINGQPAAQRPVAGGFSLSAGVPPLAAVPFLRVADRGVPDEIRGNGRGNELRLMFKEGGLVGCFLSFEDDGAGRSMTG